MASDDQTGPRGKGKSPTSATELAEGSGVHRTPEPSFYRVTIEYVEPTYAAHAGSEARTYRGTFRVEALSPSHAEQLARAEFAQIARVSSVGWTRDIVRVMTTEE